MAQSKGDWRGFAATLSGMPDVVGRLLGIHRDDGTGHCLGCTTPGRGTPSAVWPCGIAVVAKLAAGLAAERARRHET